MREERSARMRLGKIGWQGAIGAATLVMIGSTANAQQTAPPPPAAQTAPALPVTPAADAKPDITPQEKSYLDYAKEQENLRRMDWGNLKHFKDDNAALAAPAPGEKRVVFMGDSITQNWAANGVPVSPSDPAKAYVNRGISGQTTPQMLLRFRQDVIELKPSVVVILAGINDIAGNTGDMTLEQTEDNLASMTDLAHANGIKVVMCSVLPAFDFPWRHGREPAPKVLAVNQWIKDYAAGHGYVYVDFYAAMADARPGLPTNLSPDGVHPNPAGYAIMNPLVDAGIAKALASN